MALSMDEQRVLAEIERRLTSEDPGLAACMTNFRRPGPAAALRSPRWRIIGSLFTVLVVAMISLMVYAMIPFRGHATRSPAGHPGVQANTAQMSVTGAHSSASRSGVTISASGSSGKKVTATTASGTTGNRTAATGTASKAGTTAHSAKPQTTSSSHATQTRSNTAGS